MAFKLVDRVRESTISPGTGTATLAGAALGYQTFSAGVGANNTTYYVIADQSGANWEVGYGTVGAGGTTLARTTVLSSSNAGSLVNFASGTQDVWVDYPATKAVWLDINGDISQAIRNISGITGAITFPESITFDTAPAIIPTATGSMYWDAGNKTPSLVLDADVSLQIGQESVALVYNGTGVTIPNGSVVAVTGAQGQRPSVVLADADSESTSSNTLGIATEDILNGAEGFVTTFGFVRGLNTAAFTAGAAVYLSQTAGQFTSTRPTAPAHTVTLGWVIKVNASSGELFVNISNGWELDELHNVLITSPTGGQLLAYDQTNTYWKNISLGAGTGFAATAGTGGTLSIGASVAAIGTWMGTPSSANLLAAMTDETGTGSLVFANTPTLISPLLGTPTSGNLSNCTNIPAGQLTGTIPSAVLGNSTLYVGTTAIALNRASANLALTGLLSGTFQGSTSGSVQLIPAAVAGTGTVLTMPATTGTIITSGDSATVTNTMLAGSIANAKLLNSSVTFNGVAVALGASGTITAANPNALTIGTGLSGTSYNGSAAVTIANTGILSITGTAPVSASTTSGATTISMAAASSTVNGYLTSTDWNTFNNKTSNTGTVTSVSGTGTVSGLTLSGTVTTSGSLTLGGTLAVTASNFSSQTANTFLAAPNGAAGVPTFRAIVAADIPTLNQNTTGTASNVTGTVAIGNGGTGATTAATARTNLGATTVGGNFFTLANPTAITFPRINADNTVSALDAATFRTAIGAGTSSTTGTVTSVATGTGLTGGTITTSGTISLANTAVTAGSYAAANVTVDAQGRLTAAASSSVPQVTAYYSSSGTYTTPTGARQLYVRMVGGGGGGQGISPGVGYPVGGAGGTTSFGSFTAVGGNAQSGGGGGTGSATVRINGTNGTGQGSTSTYNISGPPGSSSPFGSGGGGGSPASSGQNAPAGTGAGGGGCGAWTGWNSVTGYSGGSSEYVEFVISSPAASYSWAVGAGGAGGAGSGASGGNGGGGALIITALF